MLCFFLLSCRSIFLSLLLIAWFTSFPCDVCSFTIQHCQLLLLLFLLLSLCFHSDRNFSLLLFLSKCSFSQQVIVVHLHEPVLLLRDFCFVTSKDSICWSCCKRQLLLYGDCQIQSLHHLRYRFAIMMLNA